MKINLNKLDLDKIADEPTEIKFKQFEPDEMEYRKGDIKKHNKKFPTDKRNKPHRGGKRD